MLKFIKGKGHQPSAERLKVQKELFSFSKTVAHGFPHKPSALAWDPKLKLMAIGTHTGQIRIYGTPGVEFSGQHDADVTVCQLYFLPSEGRIISLCSDQSLHLWEIDEANWILKNVKSLILDEGFRKISTCCLKPETNQLLIGTESGNVHVLDVAEFQMSQDIIYQEVVMQNVPDDFKVNPGAVEGIEVHPSCPDKVLIGYNRGLIVLWDNTKQTSEHTYVGNQDLHSVSWHRDGTQFTSAHSDGSYITWSTSDSSQPLKTAQTPYGPFPCKAITKLIINSCKGGDDFVIFSGGMPRATYGEKNSVTIMWGDKHQVLDFTSKVISFFTISDASDEAEFDSPHSLVVLVEEEVVAIDLETDDWPQFSLPYLASLHSSAITCSQYCGGVPDSLWKEIKDSGNNQNAGKYSQREWPITGGLNLLQETKKHDLLLTGHEDGTIRFWDVSGVALSHLYTLSTSAYFVSDEPEQSPGEEEEWPPFRKVGSFDPYSDDPRLAIKKILLCSLSGTLVVAGTAGQVVILEMKAEPINKEVDVSTVNIVCDRDNFVWKGHDQLTTRQGGLAIDIGFQPVVVMQVSPPAAITALAMHSEWCLVAAGTAHGFGLFDYVQKKTVMAKCTLNPTDMNAAGDTSMSRRKSFKKSLRESFRRLRKGRSQRGKRDKTPSRGSSPDDVKAAGSSRASPVGEAAASASASEPRPHSPVSSPQSETAKPVERQVEARSMDDALGSMVRCLYLAQSFIINNAVMSPTLWAGTNSGAIYVFTISLPKNDKRNVDPVACQLGKEIQLKHRAPVIAIQIMDHTGYPLPEPQEVKYQRAKSPDTAGSHRVLICSEEQFKVFTLPSLKPYCKYKLTAQEGARVRKIGTIKFQHRIDECYSEHCLTCLTNQGDIIIYSIPELRKQMTHQCIKREDINGISSLVLTQTGQGLYLHSPCEFQRFSISAHSVLKVSCSLELPEGSRPKVEPPAQEPVVVNDHSPAAIPSHPEDNEESERKVEEEAAIDVSIQDIQQSVNSPEVNGEKEALSTVLTSTPKSKDIANLSNDEEKKELDTTVDSVRDHFATITTEESSVVEKREEFKTVKTQETKVTVTSMTYTETHVNSTDH